MKIIKYLASVSFFLYGLFFGTSFVLADGEDHIMPTKIGADVTMTNPMGEGVDVNPNVLIGRLIKIALGVVGSVGLALFTYSGLLWMSAAGSADRIQKAKKVMIWTVVGMTVIFLAYALVKTIIETIS